MNRFIPHQRSQPSYSRLFVNMAKVIFPVLLLFSLAFADGWHGTIYANQTGEGNFTVYADPGTGGIRGYVVGGGNVAASTCPDTDTTRCPIRLTLTPGTIVLIVDNVVGSNVPGSGTTWRKIVYQGIVLYVPLRYISINAPDISLIQVGLEDNSTAAPNSTSGQSTATQLLVAPASVCTGTCKTSPPPCPPGWTFNPTKGKVLPPGTPPGTCTLVENTLVTWYVATDGRIDGLAGDRIAIYCRLSGRLEVWSINNSAGYFLVSFNHTAVDAAGKTGFNVTVPGQGVVTIGGDGHGLYWAAIHGGPYNATGTGDFAKIFHCFQQA